MAITLKQSDLVEQVRNRVDDTPDSGAVVEWLNAGTNILAIRVGAIFPQLSADNAGSQLVFDDKWAEIPVLYACGRFKLMDLMYTDADRYMQQFETLAHEFVARYVVPPQYADSPTMQQFTAAAGQTSFTITNETFDNTYDGLTVYKNSQKLVQGTDYTFDSTTTTFVLITACTGGEYITARWEQNEDFEMPPYSWFKDW